MKENSFADDEAYLGFPIIPERPFIREKADMSSSSMRSPLPPSAPFLFSLWILASLGIGTLCGFGILYRFWMNACEQILIDYQKNSTTTVLDIQHSAVSRQEALLQSHGETLQKLSQITDQKEAAMNTIKDLQQQLEIMEQEKIRLQDQMSQQEKRHGLKYDNLQQQLELSRIMLREKIEQVEKLKEQNHVSDHQQQPQQHFNEEIVAMQTSIRQYAIANLLLKYEVSETPGKSSILVEFWIRNDPNQKPTEVTSGSKSAIITSSFQIEITHAQIQQTPHTIYTFLELVERGLYHETTITSGKTDHLPNTIVGTFPSSKKSKFIRKYAENGYQIPPVWFSETSSFSATFPCHDATKLVVSMIHRGPEFQIHHGTTSHRNSNNMNNHSVCLGTIVTSEPDGVKGVLISMDQATIIDARVLHPMIAVRRRHPQQQQENRSSDYSTDSGSRDEL